MTATVIDPLSLLLLPALLVHKAFKAFKVIPVLQVTKAIMVLDKRVLPVIMVQDQQVLQVPKVLRVLMVPAKLVQ